VKCSRHLGEWNQFGGQAVSTFRSQTLGPHVTHILLCCYSMSGSIHLDTWQRSAPDVVTYKVVAMATRDYLSCKNDGLCSHLGATLKSLLLNAFFFR
jgi:hypothetical protein